jgi:hypothetical protein
MSSRQFTLRFMFALAAVLALIALFNRIVDPFWYYRDFEIRGFNAVKTKFEYYERHVKPALLMRERPEAIILGSSFSEIGFDPTNPAFTDNGRLTSMNMGLTGAPWGMVQCEFEFAVAHAPIKRALIGFIPGSLPLVDCAKDYASIGKISTAQLLLSDTALQASLDTVLDQNRAPTHTREGRYINYHTDPAADNRFRGFFTLWLEGHEKGSEAARCRKKIPALDAKPRLLDGQTLDLGGLRHVIGLARQHGIELVLYAYPSHAYMQELSMQCGEMDATWQAMEQIAQTIDTEAAADTAVRAYQFFGYNSITGEQIGPHLASYWHDPEHFTVDLGNIMLADMFAKHPPRLGRPLTSASIDQNYQDFLHQRSAYLQSHPDFHFQMNSLLPPN